MSQPVGKLVGDHVTVVLCVDVDYALLDVVCYAAEEPADERVLTHYLVERVLHRPLPLPHVHVGVGHVGATHRSHLNVEPVYVTHQRLESIARGH